MFTQLGRKVILSLAVSSMISAQIGAVVQAQDNADYIDADKPGVERVITEIAPFGELSAQLEARDDLSIHAQAEDLAPENVYHGDSPEELADAVKGEFAQPDENASAPAMTHHIFLPTIQTGNTQNQEEEVVSAASNNGGNSNSNVQARGDFNNDGYSDLAIGVPFEDNGTITDAGFVQVLYGTAQGLDVVNDQLISQGPAAMQDQSEARDYFGAALAVADFDNDGYDDLVVGIPGEDVGSITDAGAIQAIFGSANGLNLNRNQFLHQDSYLIVGKAEKYDRFGEALTTGDFNSDGYQDLAIGVPYEDTGWREGNAGAVNIIRGTQAGLNIYRNFIWTQDSSGIVGGEEANDYFGMTLAAGNFDNKYGDDLAIGVPGEDHSSKTNPGAVNVIYSQGSNGLGSASNKMWHQNVAGILDSSENGDQFGDSLTAGDFNNDGKDDLAVGIPREALKVGTIDYAYAGAVQIIYGSTTGLKASANQLLSQAYPGIYDHVQANERFGESVATGDFNNDGYNDLVVGVPQEDTTVTNAGVAHIIYGSSSGITAINNKVVHKGLSTIAGTPRSGDQFGHAFSIGDFNGDNYDDVMVAVPYADVGSVVNAGAVVVIYNNGYSYWSEEIHQDTPGINGIAEPGDRFSYAFHQ